MWGSDMLYYLDDGLRSIGDPFILNRYAHVYTLRVASLLAGSTLSGMRLISAMAAGFTVLLSYLSARFLTKDSRFPNGLIAVLLILSLPLAMRFLLAPSVDTTLMVVILMFIALYVMFTRYPGASRALLVGMGILFFMAIRTKEVGVVLLAFIPGFGWSGSNDFNWSALRFNLRYFLAGTAIGILITVVANSVFIGIPLFGFRLSDISSYIEVWSGIIGSGARPASSLSQLLVGQSIVLFVLFIAAGLWFGNSLSKPIRVVWLFPLLIASFLLIATTRDNWTIVPRGFLSGFAVMGILASRVFTVRLPVQRTKIWVIIVTAVIASGFALFGFLTKDAMSYSTYFERVLIPTLLVLALAIMIVSQSREQSGWAVFILLLALAGFSASSNVRSVTSEIHRSSRYPYRFALPLAFRHDIDLDQPFDAFVSWGSLERIAGAANSREVAAIFNVALDGRTDRTDYEIGSVKKDLLQSMESGDYKYVIVNSSEWDWMRTAPQDRPEWRAKYTPLEDPGGWYVLLTLKGN